MTHIPESMRRAVIERAQACCEYCLLGANDGVFAHEVDHILSEKHRGQTDLNNLCFACFECNRHKGSDIASLDVDTNTITPLYNPRLDRWSDHFRLVNAWIEPLTAIGRVTTYLLQMNAEEQLALRTVLIDLRAYPCKHDIE